MTDEFTEESGGDQLSVGPYVTGTNAKITSFVDDIAKRQAPFLDLIELYHKLFWELPNLTVRDVDARLQVMFEKLMEASATVGISRMSVPSLRECCGKKRVWPDELGESQLSLEPVADGLGDFFTMIFEWMGFKACAGCERRRRWLNGIRWPWSK